jgi:excisionase family DNA binding protein
MTHTPQVSGPESVGSTSKPKLGPRDRYLTLDELSAYSGLSVRKLRDHLRDADHPLPCYRPGGRKIVVKLSEFDRWMAAFRYEGDPDLREIVGEILRDLN